MSPVSVPTPAEGVEAFLEAFRQQPSGLALITASTPEGPVGLTASSVASVSLNPPTLSFSLGGRSTSAARLLAQDNYLVHLLDEHNVQVAWEFSRSGPERFTRTEQWQALPSGEPWLVEARVALRCRALQKVPVGESTLVVAEVTQVLPGRAGKPLAYLNRTFRALGAALPLD